MKKSELLKILAKYDDDQEIWVEAIDAGFDDPVVYVTAVRGRNVEELVSTASSEYVSNMSTTSFGAVILGTSLGLARMD
jgi:hypothetical protein